jgi:excisionase family DNA binding protein
MLIITDHRPNGESPALYQELLTSGEAAAVLQVVPQTVARWANDGTLECTRTAGGHRRFRETDVQALRGRMYGASHNPDVAIVAQALADAVAYRSVLLVGCSACAGATPEGCAEHRDDAARVAGYERLLRSLVTSGEVG